MASSGDRGVVVKNTFLEVGDHKSLLERSDGWRRQMSEPVKIFMTSSNQLMGPQQDTLSELDESEDDLGLGDPSDPAMVRNVSCEPPPEQEKSLGEAFSSMLDSACGTNTAVGGSSTSSAKPPKVLLLSESIPFKKGGSGAPGGKEQRGGDAHSKDGYLNNLKDKDITKKEPPWTNVTTVMMRNLPNKYTQHMLLEELQDSGFRLQQDFDFFYLPMDHSNAANLGYCFINFTKTNLANAFAAAFQGKKMRNFNSNKTVVVMPASIQGFERNYAYYSSTRVAQAEDPAYRPLFLRVPPSGGQACAPNQSNGKASAKSKGNAGKAGTVPAGGGNHGKGNRKGNGREKDGRPSRPDDSFFGHDGYVGGGFQDPMYSDFSDFSPQAASPGTGSLGGCMHGQLMNHLVNPAPTASSMQIRVCPSCGNEVGSAHRFCAFCGSFCGQDAPTVGGGAGSMAQNHAMLAQAHLQTPFGGMTSSCGGCPAADPSGMRFAGVDPTGFGVTDELDVMRSRQMLIAALKDMERREIGGQNMFGVAERQW